ncbi:hypothetical protein NDU88_003801 [Pleurodeles waltl]|uniref:Uncharacterized protein n=1 Tax=Pleurodeles waltl TaxID=8319 RepID=A0AAV7WVU9_PLEWA|nr:hypothetical protein NDU88_003801 [Pleurodeles waltl]
MLNNIPRSRKRDPTDAAARSGPDGDEDAVVAAVPYVQAHVIGAQPDMQLKTLNGQQGLIAERAHGGAARLRSSNG